MKKIEMFLNGEINAEDFSYDFPVTYSLYAHQLDDENPAFSRLMEEKVKMTCRAYDPYDFYHMDGPKIQDESIFTERIKGFYEEAKKLL